MDKRREILAEFLYYLFDSFLIPLICGNFYVTESNTHRNRLFYFRHDVWRLISEPAWSSLKADKFEEVKPSEAARILGSRDLSYSQIRLLPKQQAMRTITNLRRRAVKKGDKRLTSSTNTVLAPVAAMLNLEMVSAPFSCHCRVLHLPNSCRNNTLSGSGRPCCQSAACTPG